MPAPEKSSPTAIVYSNLQDIVTSRIREMILNGQFKMGDWLRQDELAGTLGVSTMPVREALRRLQAEGLVVFHPNRGATVARLSLSNYEEIYRMREELEVLACQWAAEDFSRIPLETLHQALSGLEEAEAEHDVPRRLELVRQFFFAIFQASGKEQLLRILTNLWTLSEQYRHYFSLIPDIIPARMEYYHRIYQACANQDQADLISAIRGLYSLITRELIPRIREYERQSATASKS